MPDLGSWSGAGFHSASRPCPVMPDSIRHPERLMSLKALDPGVRRDDGTTLDPGVRREDGST